MRLLGCCGFGWVLDCSVVCFVLYYVGVIVSVFEIMLGYWLCVYAGFSSVLFVAGFFCLFGVGLVCFVGVGLLAGVLFG